MIIKDIIVNLGVPKNDSVAGNYAVSVAAALGAHLTGVGFIYDPIIPISDGGYIPAEVIETQRADNAAAAEATIKSFSAATDRAGVSVEPLIRRRDLTPWPSSECVKHPRWEPSARIGLARIYAGGRQQ